MKLKYLLPMMLICLSGCASSKGYKFAYRALDELQKLDIENIEVSNALYHAYDKDNKLDELVVIYYFYDEGEYEDLDAYALYTYDREEEIYNMYDSTTAEMYFYNAISSDNENYISLDVSKLNDYLDDKK